jgi:DNA (cytosine-5)-methyltransferase 1
MSINAIDLFCGAGGLTRGLIDAGVRVLAGFDTDKHCQYAYEANNEGAKFHCRDVATVTGVELNRIWGKGGIRLLAGCAPCQPFSTASHSKRDTERPDPRYPLLEHFARLVRTCRPELVTMENVPSVQHHAPFIEFTTTLEELGYQVWYSSVACAEYGVPQSRRRLVLMASRLGEAPKLTRRKGAKKLTVADAIKGLPELAAGGRDAKDRIHFARNLSSINLRRIQHCKPGGTWKDWPEELRSACHIKETGSTYRSVYARMRADQPSPTITTQFYNFGTGRFGHPEQDRAISPREAALLQSFPKDYDFVRPKDDLHLSRLGRMIGNAVPPKLGEAIGSAFIEHEAAHKAGRR